MVGKVGILTPVSNAARGGLSIGRLDDAARMHNAASFFARVMLERARSSRRSRAFEWVSTGGRAAYDGPLFVEIRRWYRGAQGTSSLGRPPDSRAPLVGRPSHLPVWFASPTGAQMIAACQCQCQSSYRRQADRRRGRGPTEGRDNEIRQCFRLFDNQLRGRAPAQCRGRDGVDNAMP